MNTGLSNVISLDTVTESSETERPNETTCSSPRLVTNNNSPGSYVSTALEPPAHLGFDHVKRSSTASAFARIEQSQSVTGALSGTWELLARLFPEVQLTANAFSSSTPPTLRPSIHSGRHSKQQICIERIRLSSRSMRRCTMKFRSCG